MKKNRYTIESFPVCIEYGMFSQINEDDILNNGLRVLIDTETSKSINISLYCGRKRNTINKKVLTDVSYLTRSWFDGYDYETKSEDYIKINNKQIGSKLIDIIKKQVDNFLPINETGFDVKLCFHDRVRKYIDMEQN